MEEDGIRDGSQQVFHSLETQERPGLVVDIYNQDPLLMKTDGACCDVA